VLKKNNDYLPNKFLIWITEKLFSFYSIVENYTYKKMYDRLDYLYDNGMFVSARDLINSVETNTTTVRMPIDLRLKEMDYYEKEN
jgi:hypothetical protein